MIPIVHFKDIAKISTGKYDVNHSTEMGKYPFFTCAMGQFRSDTFSFDDKVIILPGNGANVGQVFYFMGQFEAYQRTYVLHEIQADVKYIYYFFKGFWAKSLIGQQFGSATNYIRYNNIAEFKIPLPPFETQKKITAILDKADELRQNDKKILEKYDQLAQSVFLEMFGDPIMNTNKWVKKKLVEVCKKITDGTHHSPPMCSYGVPYVTAKHIKKYGLNFETNPTYISEEDHKPIFKRCPSEYGDVLYIKDGATTGIAAINTFKQEISLLSSLALLKPDTDQISSIYLCSWLNNENVKAKLLMNSMAGAAIQRFTLEKIKNFVIQVPDLKLQSKFSEIIQDIDRQRKLTQNSLEKSEDLFHSLLQRAFRGELV
jgi:type I restriction enzyme S subunit